MFSIDTHFLTFSGFLWINNTCWNHHNRSGLQASSNFTIITAIISKTINHKLRRFRNLKNISSIIFMLEIEGYKFFSFLKCSALIFFNRNYKAFHWNNVFEIQKLRRWNKTVFIFTNVYQNIRKKRLNKLNLLC